MVSGEWPSVVTKSITLFVLTAAVSCGGDRMAHAHHSPFTSHCLLLSLVQQPSDSVDPDQAFLDALRERKLFRLLETYCRKQLARSDATPVERARYTIELANILAARAQVETVTVARAELWQQASALLRGFLESNPQHPQAAALQFQLGVYELAQGELARQHTKLAPQNKELIDSARSRLQAAVQSFRRVESDATEAMKKRSPGDGAAGDQPTHNQLRALTNNTRYRLGQALLALAQTYPRHSADQTDAASRAKTFFEAFTQRYSPNELTLESYLGRAECLRLLGDAPEATKTLGELRKGTPPPPDKYLDRSLVIQAQLQLDQKKPAAARNFIDDSRKLLKSPIPELDLLYVQAMLELAREQSKGQANLVARQLVASALAEMDRIEKEHGVFWVSRCELLLAELAAENVLVEDPSVLVRMADGQFRRGDRAGTVRTLDRAVKLARERGDENQTVEMAFRAASIMVQDRQFEEAAGRFSEISTTYAKHSKAALAQFMVAHCLGQAYAADRSTERLTRYEQSLEQHLRAFGNHETAGEVRWLLGSLRTNQRRWNDAIDLFAGIPQSSKRFAAARQEIRRTYESWLGELWARGQPDEKVATGAIQFLKQSLAARRGSPFTTDDVAMALTLSRILTHPSVARHEESEELLEQVLFGEAANELERGEARRLTVTALLGQDKFDAARRMIETEFVGVPQELFAVVQSLEDTAGRSSETRRRQVGKLQLVATERLVKEGEQLTREQILQAEIYLALAYVNAGEANRADELFSKMRDRVPNSPRVLEAQAECFMQLGRFAQARELWRQLLGIVRENTQPWYRAKYNLALACYHSGDAPQCLKIILITEQLHPELGGAELKAKFEQLKSKCQNP